MYYVATNIKKIRPVVLLIDPIVICWESTKFSDYNATDNKASIGQKIDDFELIEFNLATQGYDSSKHNDIEKKCIQAEVLVKEYVPLRYIMCK
ncbi:MAG: hypothetical protein CI953_1383 [Methanohalophilus sp.]|nr:MAG: hypothetical protein CI953_1383 [Methanohalophilus sp.]